MAKAIQADGRDEIVYVSSGEGATSEGEYFEALNLAAREKLPVLFMIQNNGYAISVPQSTQTGSQVDRIGRGFEMEAVRVDGTRFTEFYVSPTCSPTRSMLLSGTDMHAAGLGNMDSMIAPNQLGHPGYEGVLNQRVVTMASLLRDGGYHTYMVGKWHLGYEADEIPRARGFERDFALLPGGGSHFDDQWNLEWQRPTAPYTEDGRPLEKLPKGFYSTKTFTDKMIDFIGSNRSDGKPFLAYMAYTAPHGPLHGLPDRLRSRASGCRPQSRSPCRAGTGSSRRSPSRCHTPRKFLCVPTSRDCLQRNCRLHAANLVYRVGR
jgi:arylsulfatase A-like enzyme